MKCPQCNYVSFDSMPRCKKCGYHFKPERSRHEPFDISAIVPKSSVKRGEADELDADAARKKTVSSIRESLADIDGKSSADGIEPHQEQTYEIDTDDLKFQVDSGYMDASGQFTDGSEINWEESMSLNDDKLKLSFHEDDPAAAGPDEAETSADQPFTAGEHFKGTLRQMGEELQEIEDGPQVTGDVQHRMEEQPVLFDTPAGQTTPEEEAVTAQVSNGGFWIRAMAYLIDTVILEFLSIILMLVGMLAMSLGPSGMAAMDEERIMGLIAPYYLFSTVVTIFYFTYFHGSVGQTPGKMLCGLKVVRVNGEPLGYGRAFLRWVGYLPSSLFFGIGFLWIAWDRHKQAWHDKIADTQVIRL